MKIGILGAGALGRVYGAYLSRDNDVTMIVRRNEQCELINREGIAIEEKGSKTVFPVRAVLNGKCDDKMDVIIIFVKGYDTESAIAMAKDMIDDKTIVATMQNGMGNYEVLERYINPKNIVVGTSAHGAYVLDDISACFAGKGLDHIGIMPKGDIEKAKRVFLAIKNAGFNSELNGDIREFLWTKLFMNAASNCVTALLEAHNFILTENEFVRDIVKKIITEAVLVSNAYGMKFDIDEVLHSYFEKIGVVKDNKSSMYQDIEKGRKTEIDTINGAIIEYAHKLKIDVPVNEMMYTLIKAKESI